MSSSVPTDAGRPGRSFLTKYFLLILLGFACLSLLLSSRFTHHEVQDASIIQSHLRESVQSLIMKQQNDTPLDKLPKLKNDHAAAAQTVAQTLTKTASTNDNKIETKKTKNTDSTTTATKDKGAATLVKSKDTSAQATFKIGQNSDSTASNNDLKYKPSSTTTAAAAAATTTDKTIPKTAAAITTAAVTDKIVQKDATSTTTTSNNQTAAAITTAAVADKIVQKDTATTTDKIVQKDATSTNNNPVLPKTATATTAADKIEDTAATTTTAAVADKIVQKDAVASTTTTSSNQTIPKPTATITTTVADKIVQKDSAAATTTTSSNQTIPKPAAANTTAAAADKIVQKDASTTTDKSTDKDTTAAAAVATTATTTKLVQKDTTPAATDKLVQKDTAAAATASIDKLVQKDTTTTAAIGKIVQKDASTDKSVEKDTTTAASVSATKLEQKDTSTTVATDKIVQKDTTAAVTTTTTTSDKVAQKDTTSTAAAATTNKIVQKDTSAAATTPTNETRKVTQDIVHQGLPNPHASRVAGLNCDKYGGPSPEAAQEMVYWEDIPSDAKWISPFHYKHRQLPTQYMTFEPDLGGWNNIRMAMETVLGMAFAMGRTLVLPPHQKMYLLNDKAGGQRNAFSFEHFFHMERIHEEHTGLDIISMKEFLEIVMKGTFIDPKTNQPVFPPGNRTDWDGADDGEQAVLKQWLRNGITSTVVRWNPEECLAAFPATADPADMESLKETHQHILDTGGMPPYTTYIGKPNPVNASVEERLKENAAERTKLCLYDKPLQDARWLHFPMEYRGELQNRLLVHFYAFLFFQDWKTDLWMKRFIRDHVRYIDEIQCAAARVVQAIRKRVQKRGIDTDFDTMHVRRGDFQYTVTRSEAHEIYEMTSQKIPDNTTLYIATDERNKAFFDPLKKHYDVVFLDDFMDAIEGVNSNYYGMIDQLVSSRGRLFYGCWFSTFTGYINRLRGYHADDHETPGYQDGIVPSYYYALKDRFLHMQEFYPVKKSFYAREFPTSWRLIDTGLDE